MKKEAKSLKDKSKVDGRLKEHFTKIEFSCLKMEEELFYSTDHQTRSQEKPLLNKAMISVKVNQCTIVCKITITELLKITFSKGDQIHCNILEDQFKDKQGMLGQV